MSDHATITETCPCGATLRITAWPPHALAARRDFAAEHSACRTHSEVITLCGEPA